MKKVNLYRIQLKVHPMVFRFIDNNAVLEEGAYNLTKSHLYCFLSSMLCRSCVEMPSRVYKRYEKYVPIQIYITEFDFYHYGWNISELQQCMFSKFMMHNILQNACHEIAVLHIVAGVPRRRAICHFIDENLYEENELNYSYLQKYYQRKYMDIENEMRESMKQENLVK